MTLRNMPRRLTWIVVTAFAAAATISAAFYWKPVLRSVGWALVGNEPVAPADTIVISLDSGGAGALEAADLVQSGIAKRVAVFVDSPGGHDLEFIRRGLSYEDWGETHIRQLRSLGVTDVMQIPPIVAGIEGQGQVLP